jgi:TrmH family RNA methyltransferase
VSGIDSPRNPRLRAAAGLRERRDRQATGLTLVDGGRECRRAIDAGVVVETAFVCTPLLASEDARTAVARLRDRRADLVEVSERAFERLAFGERNDGIVLVVRQPATDLARLLIASPEPLLLVTEEVEKPGNLGAILRTADAAGCEAVIAIGGTDLFNPNVIRASIGTVFSVRIASAPAAEVLDWLRRQAIRPIAARVDAADLYTAADLCGSVAIVLGSESEGLSAAWEDPSIAAVRLPMRGIADSLNVSVAAAILAFEARRQRDAAAHAPGPVPGRTARPARR